MKRSSIVAGFVCAISLAAVLHVRVNRMNDPALKDKDLGEFHLFGVPLAKS
jgi:hypothetical protein